MKKRILIIVNAALIFLGMISSSDAALLSRLGGQTVYDTVLDITWLADANLAATNKFGLTTEVFLDTHPADTSGVKGLITASGNMNWPGTLFWIDAMNTANYLGFNDWRLPITTQPDSSCGLQSGGDGFGYGCIGSEMGHLFNVDGITAAAPGLFSNVQSDIYWSGTPLPSPNIYAWSLKFSNGWQGVQYKGNGGYAWAVRNGDVNPAPIPAAVWLFGSGLIGLLGLARRKR